MEVDEVEQDKLNRNEHCTFTSGSKFDKSGRNKIGLASRSLDSFIPLLHIPIPPRLMSYAETEQIVRRIRQSD